MKNNITYCSDENYLQYFFVSLFSLLKNCSGIELDLFLVTDCKNSLKLNLIGEFFVKNFSVAINCIEIKKEKFVNCKISHHINHSTYYRFILPDILPDSVDKLLYLDADTIINGDISSIFDLTFDSDIYLYACDHLFKPEQKLHLRRFGLYEYDEYFNAGVLFIDLKKWREEGISKKLMDFAYDRFDDILWWDQDVLNVFFHKKWKKLHPKYNVIWEVLESNSDNPEIKEAKENPVIVHYTRSVKPWHSNSYHPLRHLYWEYRNSLPAELLEVLK
ncbi:MAG: hypothetical protein PWR24_763 [Desulfonauticus sp.]|jgi:lipopolysaccharide biosynthesis glycosyltransferase|nr:hypothetical protein [Desulfonauticus sp.]